MIFPGFGFDFVAFVPRDETEGSGGKANSCRPLGLRFGNAEMFQWLVGAGHGDAHIEAAVQGLKKTPRNAIKKPRHAGGVRRA
jgi:hypothetical protein